MTKTPELTDDAIIELAREGGIAWIPKLAVTRRFVLASVPQILRQQLCTTILNVAPQAQAPDQPDGPGRGDQFYYRIHISYSNPHHPQDADVILLIPEQDAPQELEELWRNGLPE